MRLLARYYWLFVSPAYWILALFLLLHASPISVDGSGATATFYLGQDRPTLTLDEYRRHPDARLRFLSPYGVAAVIVTLLGCSCTPRLACRLKPGKSRSFFIVTSLSLMLLLLAALVSDVGETIGLWVGSRFYVDLSSMVLLLEVFIPLALTTGLLALVRPQVDREKS